MDINIDSILDADKLISEFNSLSLVDAANLIWSQLRIKPSRSKEECIDEWIFLGLNNRDFLKWVIGGAVIENML